MRIRSELAIVAIALTLASCGGAPDGPADPSARLRADVVARYGDAMIADLQEMIRFRTVHEEGRDNWDAPEFLRQREWLRAKAESLGLEFRSIDGRVDEIVAPGGPRVLGILTHGDVQGVEGQNWSVPPWEGRLVDGRIIGRGAEDDKGPIVTAMYVLAALRDSGLVNHVTLRLMIANGEECCWDEIPYYRERVPDADVTIGFDASYPVTHAQKAWGVLEILAERPKSRFDFPDHWEVLAVEGGSGLSIIPERAEVRLRPPADADSQTVAAFRSRARDWAAAHPPARLDTFEDEGTVRLVATGKGGHSSEPESGHNAFGDLTRFLYEQTKHETLLVPTDLGPLLQCVGLVVGTETDGSHLGIAHEDEIMGALTTNLASFDLNEGNHRARINVRVPRGIDAETIVAAATKSLEECTAAWGFPFTATLYMPSPPHFVEPDGPLVRTLLDVWEQVTGEPGHPVAIGGGTQARLFPDGVDFGPALAMERYRGHGPDEYITVDEMHRNAELTIAALWELSAAPF